MTPTISGKSAKIEALPFCRFLDRAADLEAIARRQRCRGPACSAGQIWFVTSGGCTPSTTSARTVIDMSRLRRHRIGSSCAYSMCPTCASGTARPSRETMVRSPMRPRSRRSAPIARATTSTFSVPSRTLVTVTPESSVCSVCDTSCGSRPSARARSWSTTRRTDGVSSFQSRCGSTTFVFARIVSRTS